MSKAVLKLALFFICLHFLLGLILLAIEATHGINDMDASFAVAMLFYGLNLPTIWLLGFPTGPSWIFLVLLVGIVQWTVLAWAMVAVYRACGFGLRLITGQATKTADPDASPATPVK